MGYKNLSTSRGDGNNCSFFDSVSNPSCIRTYLPREGTETRTIFQILVTLDNCIRTYLPREGTETLFRYQVKKHQEIMYKNLSTSRGDGNELIGFNFNYFLVYKNLSTSRGDGN